MTHRPLSGYCLVLTLGAALACSPDANAPSSATTAAPTATPSVTAPVAAPTLVASALAGELDRGSYQLSFSSSDGAVAYAAAVIDGTSCEGATVGDWRLLAEAFTFTVEGAGPRVICARAKDAAGHESATVAVANFMAKNPASTPPPAGSGPATGGGAVEPVDTVAPTLGAAHLAGQLDRGAHELFFSTPDGAVAYAAAVVEGAACDAAVVGAWRPLAEAFAFAVAGSGARTVCACARDAAGNESAVTAVAAFVARDLDRLEVSVAPADAGWVLVGEAKDLTIGLTYNGSGMAATDVTLASPDLRFKGGAFPGIGGTCAPQIVADCTLVAEFAPQAVRKTAPSLAIHYRNGGTATEARAPFVGRGVAVLGQPDLKSIRQVELGFGNPYALSFLANGDLAVPDFSQNRLAVWSSPLATHTAPRLVLGQPDATSMSPGSGAARLDGPVFVRQIGARLVAVDYRAHRVVIWSTVPTSTGAPADVVVGQSGFDAKSRNAGLSGVSAGGFSDPAGIDSDGTRLFVADYSNNRVLVWNEIPTVSGTPASFALGQPDLQSNAPNAGGAVSASGLHGPWGLRVIGGKLYVCDYLNHRVLVWDSLPTSNVPASFVIGQTSFANASAGTTAAKLTYPYDIDIAGGKLLLADYGNNRVLVFDPVPTATGAAASFALGQADLTSGVANRGGAAGPATLSGPVGISSHGTRLAVSDYSNRRVLVWNTLPASASDFPDVVLGLTDGSSSPALQGDQPPALQLSATYAATDGVRLALADTYHHRVLIWNQAPTVSNALPDLILGQASEASVALNRGNGTPGAGTLGEPYQMAFHEGGLYVAEYSNHRVVGWTTLPTANGADADYLLGQSSFTTRVCNQGGASASSLCGPVGLTFASGKTLVTEYLNHRVLVWDGLPATGTPAGVVIGQTTFSGISANAGGAVSAATLRGPYDTLVVDGRLAISDAENSRLLFYDQIPSVSGAAASFVLGQPDFLTRLPDNGGRSATSLSYPISLSADGERVYAIDYSSHRVLTWNGMPSAASATPALIYGQPDATSGAPGLSLPRTNSPYSIVKVKGLYYLSEYANRRVLILPALD